ncbi:hypothetical protein AL035_02015 [Salipiger aestuarii]|uniref:Uncharacterized protein n=1 Tax=Salipiger aestuarii TaxID=568098 RepID=A0A327Z1H5_9RHOB|nr:hypothetical protein [Salipiger aestuarii]KAB2543264.1 hypothetical protein AL035_02015 [Salipiger aestuarii]RAK24079.1 hypothetical protein ATI53_1001186 [Salipiger aestuarii]
MSGPFDTLHPNSSSLDIAQHMRRQPHGNPPIETPHSGDKLRRYLDTPVFFNDDPTGAAARWCLICVVLTCLGLAAWLGWRMWG